MSKQFYSVKQLSELLSIIVDKIEEIVDKLALGNGRSVGGS